MKRYHVYWFLQIGFLENYILKESSWNLDLKNEFLKIILENLLRIIFENWIWNLDLKIGFEYWIWKLDLKIGFESWFWKMDLKVEFESWIWKMNLKVGFEKWFSWRFRQFFGRYFDSSVDNSFDPIGASSWFHLVNLLEYSWILFGPWKYLEQSISVQKIVQQVLGF